MNELTTHTHASSLLTFAGDLRNAMANTLTKEIFSVSALMLILTVTPQINAQSSAQLLRGASKPRILHIFPDIETIEPGQLADRLSVRDKFRRFSSQTLDPSFILITAAVAGLEQAGSGAPHYGQGWGAYMQRFGASSAGFVASSLFTNAVLPSLTREDPRYYKKGNGSIVSRIWYAVSRTVITRSDSGAATPNFSEIGGLAAYTGIANLYYPEKDRTWHENATRFGFGMAAGAGINLLREFGRRR